MIPNPFQAALRALPLPLQADALSSEVEVAVSNPNPNPNPTQNPDPDPNPNPNQVEVAVAAAVASLHRRSFGAEAARMDKQFEEQAQPAVRAATDANFRASHQVWARVSTGTGLGLAPGLG